LPEATKSKDDRSPITAFHSHYKPWLSGSAEVPEFRATLHVFFSVLRAFARNLVNEPSESCLYGLRPIAAFLNKFSLPLKTGKDKGKRVKAFGIYYDTYLRVNKHKLISRANTKTNY